MISEELLQTLDPAELENLYVSTHLDKILAVRKPVQIIENSIQIRITTLNLEFSKQAYIKTIFGGKIRESNPCAPELLPKTFLFNVTYHNIIFDSVIIEFINCGSLISNDTVGRLRIKLSELESYEIQRYSSSSQAPILLGSATLELVFKGPAFNDNVSEDTIISKSEQFSSSSSNSTISRSDVSSVGTALSLLSFDKSSLSSASPNKISKKDGSLLSDRTSIGLKEVISIFSTYFSDGERLSKLQVVQSLLFLTRYYSKYYSHTITGNVVTDKDRIKESIYWLNFSCAAYGYLIVQYSGIGGGFISDLLKPDVKSAIKILGLNDSDMLVWEYKTGLEMFKPKFFICFDKVTNSIVVSFRGTLDIHDLLTDLNANFEPFYGGYAHRGILRSAVWVCEHYIQKILKYVKDYKCENLILTGHREYLPELLLNSNFKKLYCFSHGTPPICSIEIAHELKGFVDTYVNENDAITRMSYGSLLDYRELLVIGNGARSMSVSTRDKMKLIDSSRKTLAISKSNPKGFLCGDVYFLYKTSRVLSSRYIHHSGLRLFEDRGKNVVEAAEAVNFSCFIMRGNIFHHHFPNKYLSALKKALEELDRLQ